MPSKEVKEQKQQKQDSEKQVLKKGNCVFERNLSQKEQINIFNRLPLTQEQRKEILDKLFKSK